MEGKGGFAHWGDKANFDKFSITADGKLDWSEDVDMDPGAFYLKIVKKSF